MSSQATGCLWQRQRGRPPPHHHLFNLPFCPPPPSLKVERLPRTEVWWSRYVGWFDILKTLIATEHSAGWVCVCVSRGLRMCGCGCRSFFFHPDLWCSNKQTNMSVQLFLRKFASDFNWSFFLQLGPNTILILFSFLSLHFFFYLDECTCSWTTSFYPFDDPTFLRHTPPGLPANCFQSVILKVWVKFNI